MRKNKVYQAAILTTLGTGCILAAGCGEKATSKSVLTKCYENVQKVKSAEGSSEISIDMSQGESKMAVNMLMDTKMISDSKEMSAEGEIKISALGSESAMEFELYQVKEEERYVQYMEMMEQCMKESVDAEEVQQTIPVESFGMMKELYESFELSDKTIKVDDKECYEIKGELQGSDFVEAVDEKMLETMGLNGMFDADMLKDMEFPCEIAVDKKEMMPVSIRLEMKDAMEEMGLSELQIEIEECYMEQKFEKFNTVDKIEVPKELKEKAQDSSLGSGLGSFGGVEEENEAGAAIPEAQMSPDLAANWDSYMVQINDTALTLPFDCSQLQGLGLTIDQEGITDTVLKPEQVTVVFAHDAYGNQIMLDVINRTGEDLPLQQCMVGGIDASDTFLEGGLTVMLPGGIKVGSTREELLNAYGDAAGVETVSDTEVYMWEDSSSFYKNCDVSVETATGKVEGISIRNYDK